MARDPALQPLDDDIAGVPKETQRRKGQGAGGRTAARPVLELPPERPISADPASVLLSVDDWQRCTARPVPPRHGRPIVGLDLGGGRSWSAAVAVWRNGRTEAIAVAPGLPALDAQETRDRVPRGAYTALHAGGALRVDAGRRVPLVSSLVDVALQRWTPEVIICDRFRYGELLDTVKGRVPVVSRVTRWSEASEDIRALRRGAADGPLASAPESRELLQASLGRCVRQDGRSGGGAPSQAKHEQYRPR